MARQSWAGAPGLPHARQGLIARDIGGKEVEEMVGGGERRKRRGKRRRRGAAGAQDVGRGLGPGQQGASGGRSGLT